MCERTQGFQELKSFIHRPDKRILDMDRTQREEFKIEQLKTERLIELKKQLEEEGVAPQDMAIVLSEAAFYPEVTIDVLRNTRRRELRKVPKWGEKLVGRVKDIIGGD
jgi:hypothetical protein